MKASSIKEIKTELSSLSAESLQDLCLSLARFKKENKEFLSYQLFEAQKVMYKKQRKPLMKALKT
jgi:hypothetical protein